MIKTKSLANPSRALMWVDRPNFTGIFERQGTYTHGIEKTNRKFAEKPRHVTFMYLSLP